MSLLDLLFPQQAQASHLRGILRHQQMESLRKIHDSRALAGGKAEEVSQRINRLEKQVDSLVSALEESTIVTRALVELILESSEYTSADLQNLIEDIDARDGVIDGRITPEGEVLKKKFVARRTWKDQTN